MLDNEVVPRALQDYMLHILLVIIAGNLRGQYFQLLVCIHLFAARFDAMCIR